MKTIGAMEDSIQTSVEEKFNRIDNKVEKYKNFHLLLEAKLDQSRVETANDLCKLEEKFYQVKEKTESIIKKFNLTIKDTQDVFIKQNLEVELKIKSIQKEVTNIHAELKSNAQ